MPAYEDVLAVHELVARWVDAVNRADFAAAAALYTADGVWAPPGMEATGAEAIEAMLQQVVGPHQLLVQHALNPLVDVDGDTATGRWQIQEVGRDAEGRTMTILGTYDDRYTRTSGTWQFAERRFSLLLFATHAADGMVRPFG